MLAMEGLLHRWHGSDQLLLAELQFKNLNWPIDS